MSNADIGYGLTYEIDDGTGTMFEVGEVTEFTPGEATSDRVEVTHMKSPGRRREYISGMIDSGEASFMINWVPGGETDAFLRSLFASGENRTHTVTFRNGAAVSFDAALIGYSKAVPIDDRMTATITVAVSGEETWTELPGGGA